MLPIHLLFLSMVAPSSKWEIVFPGLCLTCSPPSLFAMVLSPRYSQSELVSASNRYGDWLSNNWLTENGTSGRHLRDLTKVIIGYSFCIYLCSDCISFFPAIRSWFDRSTEFWRRAAVFTAVLLRCLGVSGDKGDRRYLGVSGGTLRWLGVSGGDGG